MDCARGYGGVEYDYFPALARFFLTFFL